MNERLLQFIWQFQYFNKSRLTTTTGDIVEIITPGILNTNQGPDFNNAKIKIDSTIWAGSVEIHNKSSDWIKHQHTNDRNYKNVILHVVYDDDENKLQIPVIELKNCIANSLLNRYYELMQSQQFIACENMIGKVSHITIVSWEERLLAERLQQKSALIKNSLLETNQHWEESFWWLLAKNFGTKTNSDAFEAIAKSLPLKIIAKHKQQLIQLEALLLGQAGLLNIEFEDKYPTLLKREYLFLKEKYKLSNIYVPVYFLRMRPGNFPTLRLAQLAAILFQSAHLFSKIVEEKDLNVVRNWFNTTPNDYWNYHYTLTDDAFLKPKPIGKDMTNNIIINTIIPMLFTYGEAHQNEHIKNKAIQWMQQTMPEKNFITKGFEKMGLINKSAWNSQALIQLKTKYCQYKKCLNCAIGNAILKS